jgi:hypothetical protein
LRLEEELISLEEASMMWTAEYHPARLKPLALEYDVI